MVENKSAFPYRLRYRVKDTPRWPTTFLLACQQAMTCISGMLVVPFLMSEIACAGDSAADLRVRLISTSFVVTGIATILQTTFGMRLPLLQGPSYAFLPVLLSFKVSPEFHCPYAADESVPSEFWTNRIQLLQGSLVAASLLIVLIGATGLVGLVTRFLGPITTTSLLLSLVISTTPFALENMSLHWISIVLLFALITCAIFLPDVKVPLPFYGRRGFQWKRSKIFGQFPYLIAISIVWIICVILTITDWEPFGGPARIDRNRSMEVLRKSPWIHIPYPLQFGPLKFNLGLFLGFVASCIACTTESLGDYYTAARVCQESPPAKSIINRAVIFEGIGCILGGLFGFGTGVTTYAENIALISITKVASRITMQLAGAIMIFLGIFTKFAAFLGMIPDPMIGAMLAMGLSMIGGVALSNIQLIDAKLSRNVSIIGLSIVIAILVPMYFKQHPIATGELYVNQVLNVLLSNQILIAAVVAFALDNIAPGATARQRGLGFHDLSDPHLSGKSMPGNGCETDGYAFPVSTQRFLDRIPQIRRLPFMPDCSTTKIVPVNEISAVI